MPATPMPWVKEQFFDNDGLPANGCLLYSYLSGTTTKASVYQDAAMLTAHTNPLPLDTSGRPTTGGIFQPPLTYKYVLALSSDTDPPSAPLWTVDGVQAVPETESQLTIEGTAGETISTNQICYLSVGLGGQTAGRWYLATNANYYASAGAKKLAFATADFSSAGVLVTAFRVGGRIEGLSGLTIGATYYVGSTAGSITATEPSSGTPRRVVGYADTTTTLVINDPEVRERVFYSTTQVGNVGGGEDTLYEYVAPAGELDTDGATYHVKVCGIDANNANAKTLTVRVIEGANNVSIFALGMTTGATEEWIFECDIIRRSSTSYNYSASVLEAPPNSLTGKIATNTDANQTATWANAVTIRIAGTGTADNDIIVTSGEIYRRD